MYFVNRKIENKCIKYYIHSKVFNLKFFSKIIILLNQLGDADITKELKKYNHNIDIEIIIKIIVNSKFKNKI